MSEIFELKGCMPSGVTPKSSWDDQSSKDGLDAEKPHRNYVQSNSKRAGNVSVQIPTRFGAFWRDFPIGFPMIYKGISGFYCFGAQSESREVLYWSIRGQILIFLSDIRTHLVGTGSEIRQYLHISISTSKWHWFFTYSVRFWPAVTPKTCLKWWFWIANQL